MSANSKVNVGTLVKQPGEDLLFYFDFDELLSSSETLTGSPTVTADVNGLTIATPAIVSSEVTVLGKTISANKAIQVRISGGTDGISYVLQASCDTSASNTRQVDGTLTVQD